MFSIEPVNQKDLLTIKYLSINVTLSDLFFKENPKKHDIDLLTASIKENGFIDPPKWDNNLNEGRGGIVYGNGRLEALVALLKQLQAAGEPPPLGIGIAEDGTWCIPVKFGCDAQSEAAAKRLAIDHNNLTNSFLSPEQQALQYDEQLYKSLLLELGSENKPLTVDNDFLEELLSSVNPEVEESDNEAIAPPSEPRCKSGEIWQLGRHRLFVGDCTDSGAIASLLNQEIPGLVWSDPPYGIKCQSKDGTVGSKNKNVIARNYPIISGDDSAQVAALSFVFYQQLSPKATQIWWGANHYSYSAQLPDSSCWIVWDKKNGDSNFADCELAWTNLKGAVRKFDFLWNGMLRAGEGASSKEPRFHPNQKPIELINWFWDEFCADVELCFDPFLGSGSSIIAAQKHPTRRVFGCEIMPKYAEVAITRWEKASGEKAYKD